MALLLGPAVAAVHVVLVDLLAAILAFGVVTLAGPALGGTDLVPGSVVVKLCVRASAS
jgi:hypothetical protein